MEILSPAGDFETLLTAIKCGADAVYIGGVSFSARKNAKNFSNEEIVKAIDLCHLYRVKLYVAVNILIKEKEFLPAIEYVRFLTEAGVDGIIIQDLGLLRRTREMSDKVRINVSTQATVCSSDGVNTFRKLGADRVVLARELSFSEIKSIREKTDAELEMFVHGALCMSWSGQCLMSSVIGGRSGNRGLCAQPCRLLYRLISDGEAVSGKLPLLNTKDLCLAENIEEISKIVDSAKIEGRMKSSEYAGIVTKVYQNAKNGTAKSEEIYDMLSFFSRGGSSKGYFNGRCFEKMMDYYPKAEKVTADKDKINEIKNAEFKKVRPISFVLTANEGEPLELLAKSGDFIAKAKGDICETAKNSAINEERLALQLKKLGDTPFYEENCEIKTKGTPFVSVSSVNALRRYVCEEIEKQICCSFKREVNKIELFQKEKRTKKVPKISVFVRTQEQLDAACETGISKIYAPAQIYKKGCILACPSLTKEGEELDLKDADEVLIQNIGQIPECTGKKMSAGERLNVTNCETIKALNGLGIDEVTLSTELNLREIGDILEKTDAKCEIVCYGRIPVMIMENCVIKSAYKCTKGQGNFELEDRLGERFPIICENCRNVLLNSVPLYMADKLDDILELNPDGLKLIFTTETKEEVKSVIEAYKKALSGEVPKKVFDKITRGHFYRGVE